MVQDLSCGFPSRSAASTGEESAIMSKRPMERGVRRLQKAFSLPHLYL